MTLRKWLDPPVNRIAYVVFTASGKPIKKPMKKHLDAHISSCDKVSVDGWNKRAEKRKWYDKIFDKKEYDWVELIKLEKI